jgi:uncharacterized protein
VLAAPEGRCYVLRVSIPEKKRVQLEEILQSLRQTIVAFSGGLDSGYLLHVAHRVLGDGVTALTAQSASYPARELEEAKRFCAARGVRHLVIESHEIDDPQYAANPDNRCYFCKSELFRITERVVAERGAQSVCYGAITDDLGDHRPGMRAAREHEVRAPLLEAGLSKTEIRALAREEGVELWDKPSFACLSSRFPYGTSITPEKLRQVDQVEDALFALGFRQVRARYHDRLVRLEVEPDDIVRIASPELRERVVAACRAAGFTYVSVDLAGYRTGSQNENLSRAPLRILTGTDG